MAEDAQQEICVIIPVYNGERYIGEALDSVFAQTLAPAEIVVIDDGSTDGTAEVVAAWSDRVRYVRQANAGPTAARNHGVRLTSAPLIAFLDSDDWWAPEKLALQAQALAADSALEFTVTHVQNVWMEDLAEEEARYRGRTRGAPVPGYVTQALLMRRGMYDRLGGFDESLPHTEIMDFFMRAEAEGMRGACLDETLVYRRMHAESLSRRDRTEHLDEVFALLRKRVTGGPGRPGSTPEPDDPAG